MSENTSRTFHNGGATELVYDAEGHVLAAGESVDVPMPVSDDRIKRLLESGRLVEITKLVRATAPQPKAAKNGEKE